MRIGNNLPSVSAIVMPISSRSRRLPSAPTSPVTLGSREPRRIAGKKPAKRAARSKDDRYTRRVSEIENLAVPKADAKWQAMIRDTIAKPGEKAAAEGHRRKRLAVCCCALIGTAVRSAARIGARVPVIS
jgi:hypothetical protein